MVENVTDSSSLDDSANEAEIAINVSVCNVHQIFYRFSGDLLRTQPRKTFVIVQRQRIDTYLDYL